MKRLSFNNISKMLIFCVVMSTMLLINTQTVFSLPAVWAKCFKPGGKSPCGECHGIKPYGSGGITCGTAKDIQVHDFGLAIGTTSFTTSNEQRTGVFFSDSGDVSTKTGKGYIGAIVIYNHYSDYLNENVNAYNLCEAIEIEDYDEWLALANSIYNIDNYVDGKVLVYPNPTSDVVFVKLEDNFVDNANVISVRYEVYNSNQELLTTLESSNATDIVIIPTTYIQTNGNYFVKCYLTKENGSEIIDLPFVVAK